MAYRNWNVLEFIERFRKGEVGGQSEETLESLPPEQRTEFKGPQIRDESSIELSPQDDLKPDKPS